MHGNLLGRMVAGRVSGLAAGWCSENCVGGLHCMCWEAWKIVHGRGELQSSSAAFDSCGLLVLFLTWFQGIHEELCKLPTKRELGSVTGIALAGGGMTWRIDCRECVFALLGQLPFLLAT